MGGDSGGTVVLKTGVIVGSEELVVPAEATVERTPDAKELMGIVALGRGYGLLAEAEEILSLAREEVLMADGIDVFDTEVDAVLTPVGTWVVSLENEFMIVKFRVKVLLELLAVIGLTLLVELAVVSLLVLDVDIVGLTDVVVLADWDVLSDNAVTITVSVRVPESLVELVCSEAIDVLESIDDNL